MPTDMADPALRVKQLPAGRTTSFAFGLLVFAVALFGVEMSHQNGHLASIWLASGVILTVLLRTPRASWPRWLLLGLGATWSAAVVAGDAPTTAFALSLCDTVESILAAWLARRFIAPDGRDISFARTDSVVKFVTLCGVAPAVSALLAAWTLYWLEGSPPSAVFTSWFFANALGILLIVPLATATSLTEIAALSQSARRLEALSYLLLAALISGLAVWWHLPRWQFLVCSLSVVSVFRVGLGGAIATTVAATIAGLAAITVGATGTDAQTVEHVRFMQMFAFLNVLTVLPIAGLLEALRTSEARFRGFFERHHALMWVLGLDGSIIDANPAVVAFYGYERSTLLNMKLWDINPMGEEGVKGMLAQSRRAGNGHFVVTHRLASGELRDMEVRSTAVDFGSGPCILASLQDVTQRLRAERELSASQRLLHAVVNGSQDAIFVKDPAGRYLLCNETVARVTGRRPVEIIGRDDTFLFAPQEAKRVMENDRLVLDNGQSLTYEVALTSADGAVRSFESSIGPLRDADDAVIGLIGIARDVTERALAERRAADARKYISTLLEASPVAIITYKASGQTVSANAAAARLIGCTLEQALEQNFRTLASWETSGFLEMANRALESGTEQMVEARTVSTHGRGMWFRGRFVPFDYEGEPHLLLIGEDVGARKRDEQELRARKAHLRAVAENAADIVAKVGPDGIIDFVGRVPASDSAEQVVGSPLLEWVPSAQRPALERALHSVFSSGQHEEFRAVGSDGDESHPRAHMVRVAPVVIDGRVEGAVYTATDVTDLERSRSALLASQQRYEELVRRIPVGVFALRLDPGQVPRFDYVSPRFIQMLHVDRDDGQRSAWSRLTACHPDDRERLLRGAREAADHASAYNWEGRYILGGHVHWLRIESAPVMLDDGGMVWNGVVIDVTAQKQAEQRLGALLAEQETLLNAAPGAIWFVVDGHIQWANPPHAEMFGYASEETAALPLRALFADEEVFAAAERRGASIMAQGEVYMCEAELLRKDGEKFWASLSGKLIEANNAAAGAIWIVVDVSELHRVRRMLKSILDLAPVAIGWADSRGRVEYCNRRYEDVIGYTAEQVGTLQRWFELAYPDTEYRHERAAEWLQMHDAARAEGCPTFGPIDAWVQCGDGQRRCFSIHGGNVADVSLAIFSDVTENKLATEQMLSYAQTQRVLLREVNHRVKNNLSAIMGLIHLEEDRATAGGEHNVVEVLRQLELRVQSLATVHSLLTSGEWRPVRLADLCARILTPSLVNGSAPVIREHGAPSFIQAEQAHSLALVLSELATNTAKHGEGGVTVEIDGRPQTTAVTYRDSGRGFPVAVLSSDFNGSVGLDLVRGLVRQNLRGHMQLSNDHGAVVCIEFPRAVQGDGTKP